MATRHPRGHKLLDQIPMRRFGKSAEVARAYVYLCSRDGDYITKAGALTLNPGEATKTITIEVKGDSKKEADETFYLDLFGNSLNSLFTKNRGLGTILNDD